MATINDLVMAGRGVPHTLGVKVWTCDLCGARGTWTDGWKWLGRPEPLRVERVHCPSCPPILSGDTT